MFRSTLTLRSIVVTLGIVLGTAVVAAPGSAQAGVVAEASAIPKLVELAQQQARQANDDANAQADQARAVLHAKKVRAKQDEIEALEEKIASERDAASEQLGVATQVAVVSMAIGGLGAAAGAATCAAPDDPLAPAVGQAMSAATDAIATGTRIAKAARRRIAAMHDTAAKRVLEIHAAWVDAMIARQQDLRTTLRALAKAVAARRSC
jgi:hypothetical protein